MITSAMNVLRTTGIPGHDSAIGMLRCAKRKGLPADLNSSVEQTLRQNDATGALVPSTGVEPLARPKSSALRREEQKTESLPSGVLQGRADLGVGRGVVHGMMVG